MYLIIFAHPDNKGSHNAAILKHVKNRLKGNHQDFEVIDLYADNFDPVLRLIRESEEKTKLVARYKELISKADCLVFIHPVWWQSLPAILKGFFDIVFSPGFAHDFDPNDKNLKKKLEGKKAVIISTFGRGEKEYKMHGEAAKFVLDSAVLSFTGINVISRINWFDVRPPFLVPADIVRKIDEALA